MKRANLTRLPVGAPSAGALRGMRIDPLVPAVRLTLPALLAVKAARLAARVGLGMARHPRLLGALLALGLALAGLGPTRLLVLLGLLAALLGVVCGLWRLAGPQSYARWVVDPACTRWQTRWWPGWRGQWRGWSRYRRHWAPIMGAHGLTVIRDGREYAPSLRRVASTACRDGLLVGLLAGQTPTDYESQADALAHTFGVLACRVRVHRPGEVWLELTTTDPLTVPVPALPAPTRPDLAALPLGVTEDGQPWVLRLAGSHVLIAGATGAGKGSVLWSLIRSLGAAVSAGWVQVWGIDPKGGMELAYAAPLFSRLAYRTTDDMLLLLEDAVTAMRERQARLLGLTRLHQPSVGDPVIVVVVDELAALTAYADRDTKRKAGELLQLLLSQGRAVGVLVVAALQDPSKDVLAFRDLFPTRIALRLVEDVQVDMVLGRGAHARGATCEAISPSLPGVGYVHVEGRREPLRVRAAHVTDADLTAMCTTHPAPAAPTNAGGVGEVVSEVAP